MRKKPRFALLRTGSEEESRWCWTVAMPTALEKYPTREEALKALATTIRCMMTGDFDLDDVDLTTSKRETPMLGGWQKLLSDLKKPTVNAVKHREDLLNGKLKTKSKRQNKPKPKGRKSRGGKKPLPNAK